MRAPLVTLLVALLATPALADELAAIRTAAPSCDKARAYCFPIALHVAGNADGLVADAAWVAAQLAAANRHFEPLGVGFQLSSVDALPESAVHIETRADRNALVAGRRLGSVIDVFIAGRLDDVDVPGAVVRGVTWRRPRSTRKFIIVAEYAFELVLAHELGHFFGLPHSTYAVSIMNKTARKEPPVEQRTFADEEIAAMRPVLGRLVRNKIIVAVKRVN